MMRNNHRLQSMGIAALGSFLRKRSEVDEVSGVNNDDTTSAITSSDYNPKEDEDNEGEEDDDSVVEMPVVKVCKFFLAWDVWEYSVCLLACFVSLCCAHTEF